MQSLLLSIPRLVILSRATDDSIESDQCRQHQVLTTVISNNDKLFGSGQL